MESNRYFVYALVDPINMLPFYFGKGCNNRPYHHLSGYDKINKDKHKYIDLIRQLGHEPSVEYVSNNLEENNAYVLESFCIKQGFKMGLPLVNKVGIKRPPSRKGCKMPESAKQAISRALRLRVRKPMTNEQKLKLSLALAGRRRDDRLQVPKEVLYRLYVVDNHTKRELASRFNVSLQPINRLLGEYNIVKFANPLSKK